MDYLNLSQLFSGEIEYGDVSPSHLLPSISPNCQDSEFQIDPIENEEENVFQGQAAQFNQ